MADGLDHLDRYQLVVLAAEVAVVLQQQGDLTLQAQLGNALFGIGELLARQGGGGDLAAMVAGGIDRHAAPAGADFQQMVAGFEGELLADTFQLVQLRLLQAVVRALEHGRRVHHGRIEKLLE